MKSEYIRKKMKSLLISSNLTCIDFKGVNIKKEELKPSK